jgi:hypothetical protein
MAFAEALSDNGSLTGRSACEKLESCAWVGCVAMMSDWFESRSVRLIAKTDRRTGIKFHLVGDIGWGRIAPGESANLSGGASLASAMSVAHRQSKNTTRINAAGRRHAVLYGVQALRGDGCRWLLRYLEFLGSRL